MRLDDEQWATIRELGRFRRIPDGTWLTLQGSTDRTVYAIAEGSVRIVLTASSGAEAVVGLRTEGELVGEMAALDELPRSASMQAKGPVVAYTLPPEQFAVFLERHPDASFRLLTTMAKRLRDLVQMHAMRGESLSARIAWTLLSMMEEVGSAELRLTQQELAEWTGATREATARILTEFRKDGAVETRRGRIIIREPSLLAAVS
ncbi:MAG: Crp/Fnr family transcriptional regulator [Acidimicrobiales bacterium]